jgi:hypothetical protein
MRPNFRMANRHDCAILVFYISLQLFDRLTLTQQAGNASIAFDGNDLAILNGIEPNRLSVDNFVFV